MPPGEPVLRHRLEPELRHRVLTAYGIVQRHLPGLHDQSSHGRRGRRVRAALSEARSLAEIAAASADEANRITGRRIDFAFDGLDEQVAREYGEGILRGLAAFPEAPLKRVGTFGPGGSDDLDRDAHAVTKLGRWSAPDDMILFGVRDDPERFRLELKLAKNAGWSVAGSPMGVALHEFGHVVSHYASGEMYVTAALRGRRPGKTVRQSVSSYAATDVGELAAEVFADVMLNGARDNALSAELFGKIEQAYNRRAGQK